MSTTGDAFNPYAAPVADLDFGPAAPASGAWRAGNDLILVRNASELPDRCMKCNAPAHGYRLRKTLVWHPQGYYLLLLFNIIIYIIVALIVRKKAKVRFPLCDDHRRRRLRSIVIGWLLALGTFPTMTAILAVSWSRPGPGSDAIAGVAVVVGLAMFVAGLVVGMLGARVATTTKIDKQYVYLSNLGPDFLASIPPFGA